MPQNIRHIPKNRKITLVHRKETWVLTIHGWILILLCIANLMIFTITNIHPFLAVNAPIQADVLVVEGWLPDYAVKQAMKEFEKGSYQKLITTGVNLPRGYYLSEYKSFAELTAATLIELGFDKQKLAAVPAPNVVKHRTYSTAVALRDWLVLSNLKVNAINLFTLGVHARRSWLLFQRTLAPTIKVGVIAAQSSEYEAKYWWQSSEGVRSVISETIAYIYARFIH